MNAQAIIVLRYLLPVIAALGFLLVWSDGTASATTPEPMKAMAIDMHVDGNTVYTEIGSCSDALDDDRDSFVNDGCPMVGTSAETGNECANAGDDDGDGTINDGCTAVAQLLTRHDCIRASPGDTIVIDVTADGIVPYSDIGAGSGGMIAFSFSLVYPTSAIEVTGNDIATSLLFANSGSGQFHQTDSTPDTDGTFNVSELDNGSGKPESGRGKLARITLKVKDSPAPPDGLYDLTLANSAHLNELGVDYAPNATHDGRVAVNVDCPLEAGRNTPTLPIDSTNLPDDASDQFPSIATDGNDTWIVVWNSIGLAGDDLDILAAKSTDGGFTWSAPTFVNNDHATDTRDDIVPQISFGEGRWVVVWRERESPVLGPYYILVSDSADGGITWSTPTRLDGDDEEDASPHVFYGGGQFLAVWDSEEDIGGIGTDDDILYSTSANGDSTTWSNPSALNANASTDSGDDYTPHAAYDALTDSWLAVWSSNESTLTGGDFDIVSSTWDGSGSWSAIKTTEPIDNTKDDVWPRLAADGSGLWIAVWLPDGSLANETAVTSDLGISTASFSAGAWSAPIRVYQPTGPGFDYDPAVATDGSGRWVATWWSNMPSNTWDYEVRASLSTDNGATWGETALLDSNAAPESGEDYPNDRTADVYQDIATDGAGHWLVAWASNDDSDRKCDPFVGGGHCIPLGLFDVMFVTCIQLVDADCDAVIGSPDNCREVWNPTQLDLDGDGEGDACDSDDDNDLVADVDETPCGGDPMDITPPLLRPERVDGAFFDVDDDGDTVKDEALPGGASAFDCDGDGYTGAAEDNVYSYIGQTDGDQKTCQEYDTSHPNPSSTINPSKRWPSDFNNATFPLNSFNKIDILDLVSFLVPVKYLGTNVDTNPGDVRWDLTAGKGALLTDINIQDITALLVGPSGHPPMLGGAKAFGGPVCPWAP